MRLGHGPLVMSCLEQRAAGSSASTITAPGFSARRFFRKDPVAEFDALIADVDAGASDQFFRFVPVLAAEAAAQTPRTHHFVSLTLPVEQAHDGSVVGVEHESVRLGRRQSIPVSQSVGVPGR